MKIKLTLLLFCVYSSIFSETLILTYRLDQHGVQDKYTDPIVLERSGENFIEIKEKLPNQSYKIWNETNDFIILVSQKERDNSSMISSYYINKETQKWVHQDFGWFSLDYDVNHCVTHGKFTYLEN